MPIVTTLHTVLQEPSAAQRLVMDELLELSERIIVMSKTAIGFLAEAHNVPLAKIDLIPHGIPQVEISAGKALRESLGIPGPMILTFGLLSPDKGIQYVIEAMPAILKELPGATYILVGATHPNVQAHAGESYRESLLELAENLGVSANVRFVDRFVTTEELVQYLSATDIYVTPYLNPKQITSGTLAYSIGAGKAVISTPYWYAEELLADGRGILVPFRDSDSISDAVLKLQRDPALAAALAQKASAYGQQMIWPEVAKRYLASFSRAKRDSADRLRSLVQQPVNSGFAVNQLPDCILDHLLVLSDDTGILQHATYSTPNREEGYCVDDNARALLLTAYLDQVEDIPKALDLAQSRYLSFVQHAFNPANGRFRNFFGYDRKWLEQMGSEDSHGRSLWSLGTMVNRCRDNGRRALSKNLFDRAAPAILKTTSLRTWAYGILACDEYLQAVPHEYSTLAIKQQLAQKLHQQFELNQTADWPWFEDRLTYANARLAQALIVAGDSLGNQPMLEHGLLALKWLMNVQQSPSGLFAPIGSDGFYLKGHERAYFDQQPIEAAASVGACLRAARTTNDSGWLNNALHAFHWFLGENMLGQPLIDPSTGGCFDGLHEKRLNRNQGAESTLSYLCALVELRNFAALPVHRVLLKDTHEVR